MGIHYHSKTFLQTSNIEFLTANRVQINGGDSIHQTVRATSKYIPVLSTEKFEV